MRYEIISRTEYGRKIAEKIIEFEENEAAEDACCIEHVISENVHNGLNDYIKFNKKYPESTRKFLSEIRK